MRPHALVAHLAGPLAPSARFSGIRRRAEAILEESADFEGRADAIWVELRFHVVSSRPRIPNQCPPSVRRDSAPRFRKRSEVEHALRVFILGGFFIPFDRLGDVLFDPASSLVNGAELEHSGRVPGDGGLFVPAARLGGVWGVPVPLAVIVESAKIIQGVGNRTGMGAASSRFRK